tara:strand:- start:138 stop:308 length:171 start_codon:yes stop_codon:yes gene_type:complete
MPKKEQQPVEYKKVRRYNGPPKGSDEAKDRMAKVRAAQWAKNGLVVSEQPSDATEQ